MDATGCCRRRRFPATPGAPSTSSCWRHHDATTILANANVATRHGVALVLATDIPSTANVADVGWIDSSTAMRNVHADVRHGHTNAANVGSHAS